MKQLPEKNLPDPAFVDIKELSTNMNEKEFNGAGFEENIYKSDKND